MIIDSDLADLSYRTFVAPLTSVPMSLVLTAARLIDPNDIRAAYTEMHDEDGCRTFHLYWITASVLGHVTGVASGDWDRSTLVAGEPTDRRIEASLLRLSDLQSIHIDGPQVRFNDWKQRHVVQVQVTANFRGDESIVFPAFNPVDSPQQEHADKFIDQLRLSYSE